MYALICGAMGFCGCFGSFNQMTDLAKTNVYCSILGFISSKYNQARKISGLGN